MKTININEQINCKTFLFPDGQPHVNVSGVEKGDDIRVVCSIRSANDLMFLMGVADALYELKANANCLVVPYLMGARSDRVMKLGDSVDLRIITGVINSLRFGEVHIFDAHSEAAPLLIYCSKNHNNSKLVNAYSKPDSVLICPDAGAVKKVHNYLEWNHHLKSVAYCIKDRNLNDGSITLRVLEPEKCEGKNCVIIDDICDGGATFIAIAEQIKPSCLTLIVSHGIFSKGVGLLWNHFNHIITSDSYYRDSSSDRLTVVKLGL